MVLRVEVLGGFEAPLDVQGTRRTSNWDLNLTNFHLLIFYIINLQDDFSCGQQSRISL
jgi:hypothetical protein